jgi:hypothetical protein
MKMRGLAVQSPSSASIPVEQVSMKFLRIDDENLTVFALAQSA